MTTPSPELADRLTECRPLLRRLAADVVREYPGRGIEIDDLVQEAAVAVCQVEGRFEPGRMVPFTGFVRRRARGAMLNYLRERYALVRTPRGRPAVATERVGEMEPAAAKDCIVAAHRTDADRLLDAVGALRIALSPRERLVLRRLLIDGVTLKEIGREQGVCESRMSQVWTAIRRRLRERCEDLGGYGAVAELLA